MFRQTVSRVFNSVGKSLTRSNFFIKPMSAKGYFSNMTQFKSSYSFAHLFKYIQKNNALPEAISQVNPGSVQTTQLLSAIEQGNHAHRIFEDPQCFFYLLRLIKDDKLNFLQGVTVYTYLLGLMHFTNKQQLMPADVEVDLADEYRDFKIDRFVRDAMVTDLGHKFLNYTCNSFAKLGYFFNKNDLEKYISSLPPSECWAIKTSYDLTHLTVQNTERDFSLSHTNDYDKISHRLVKTIPFLYNQENCGRVHYWIPSATLIHHFIKLISPQPVWPQYIFGTVGRTTLGFLHKNKTHPVALYALNVRSNYTAVHNKIVGPISVLLHDYFHLFNLNYFTASERDFIFDKFIPALEAAKRTAEQANEMDLVAYLKESLFNAVDFDLSYLERYLDPKTRLVEYLARSFQLYENPDYYLYQKKQLQLPLGLVEDKVYYFINKIMYDSTEESERKIWQQIIERVSDANNQVRSPDILMQLSRAAKNNDWDNLFHSQPSSRLRF